MVLAIGVIMVSGTGNVLIPLFSVVAGGVLGELLGIDDGLNWLGKQAEARWGGPLGQGKVAGWSVTRAFVTSSLIFCVGPMTILGSIQDGLLGDYELLAIKSALDGFAAIPFAATWGQAFCSVSEPSRWCREGCRHWRQESAADLEMSAGKRRGSSN